MGKLISLFLISFLITNLPSYSQELRGGSREPSFKKSGKISYNIQKYTGLNFLSKKLAQLLIKATLKIKTKADNIDVNIKTYSTLDLLTKKAKSIEVKADELYVEGVPIKHFEINIGDPIYIKKTKSIQTGKKFYEAGVEIPFYSQISVDLREINEVINNLPKWKKKLNRVEMPIPPFGKTLVNITDLMVKIDDSGLSNVSTSIKSLEKPDSENLKVNFTGRLALEGKKILIKDLENEIEGFFDRNSDISKAFNEVLERLINPVVNFDKFERKGLKINTVDMKFENNNINLFFNGKIYPQSQNN